MPTSQPARNVLVTGGAGFIGSHLVERLLNRGDAVVVLDNFNSFYDPAIKRNNLAGPRLNERCTVIEGDLRQRADLERVFARAPFDVVVHLAAMAGVRPSLEQPSLYMDVNVNGTQHLLEAITAGSIETRLVFGSSSSVYGARSGERFLESDRVDQPLSPYAASKAANELQCYAAHQTTKLPVVCLRFFTVFGPRQRPDLAIHKFARLIDQDRPIEVFGDGRSKRDYTFISDIVAGIEAAMEFPLAGYEIINLGRSEPILLADMIGCLEAELGKQAKIVHKEFQVGDMPYTFADIEKARQLLGYQPTTAFADGIKEFVRWYRACQTKLPVS